MSGVISPGARGEKAAWCSRFSARAKHVTGAATAAEPEPVENEQGCNDEEGLNTHNDVENNEGGPVAVTERGRSS